MMIPSSHSPCILSRVIATSSACLLGIALFCLPASAQANPSAEQPKHSEKTKRYKKQGYHQRAYSHQYRKYRHYRKDHEARSLHNNPDRQPYYMEDRLGITVRF